MWLGLHALEGKGLKLSAAPGIQGSLKCVNNPFCCFEGSHQPWVPQVHAVSVACE